jgi:hypothetical protein
MTEQSTGMEVQEPLIPQAPLEPEKPQCRHEYVRLYQRKLKGLDRRLVMQRAYLPVGFKLGDFGHLSEGSYCFCSKCRARLFPRRSQAEKAAARVALAQGKVLKAEAAAELAEELALQESAQEAPIVDIHVEELEQEAVDMQDIEAEGVKLSDEDQTSCLTDEDV